MSAGLPANAQDSLLLSAPSVRYKVTLENGEETWVDNPSYYPDPSTIAGAEELLRLAPEFQAQYGS